MMSPFLDRPLVFWIILKLTMSSLKKKLGISILLSYTVNAHAEEALS